LGNGKKEPESLGWRVLSKRDWLDKKTRASLTLFVGTQSFKGRFVKTVGKRLIKWEAGAARSRRGPRVKRQRKRPLGVVFS